MEASPTAMDDVKTHLKWSRAQSFRQIADFWNRCSYYRYALYVFALSLFVHAPCPWCLAEYSDTQSLFFQTFSSPDRWFGGSAQAFGIPYVDYKFEYPPVIGFIFYITSAISLKLSSWTGVPRSEIFYYLLVLMFLLPMYLFYLKTVRGISRVLGANRSRLAFAAAGFGIAYYVVYNFDIIAIAFATLSLVLLMKGKDRSAGIFLGLSVASKIITGIILFPCLSYLVKERSLHRAERFFKFFLLTIVASFGPLLLFASRGFQEMLSWTAAWYCENCFYVLVVNNLWDGIWRLASQLLMITVPLGMMILIKRADDRSTLISRSLLMIPLVISFSYVYSPQMNVMIAPTYLLASGSVSLGILATSDFLNVLIMAFFFRSSILCHVFGIESCPAVWGRESPIQWIAFSRIALLWASLAVMAITLTLERRAVYQPADKA